MIKTCPGFCCMRFTLSTSIEETAEALVVGSYANGKFPSRDAETLLDMVEIVPDIPQWYSCNRFDRENMRCSRYSDRPLMCSEYPYNKPCTWCHLNVAQVALNA